MNGRFLFLLLLPLFLLGGCSTTTVSENELASGYEAAMHKIQQGYFQDAIAQLENLKQQTEEPRIRGRLEMGLIYAFYKKGDFNQVIQRADSFFKQYPTHPQSAYVIFLRAMAYQKQGDAHLQKLMDKLSPAGEYPEELRHAYNEFAKLIKRYPDSAFAEEAHKHLPLIRQKLARFELHNARFDLMQERYQEVLRRARYVQEYYKNPLVRKEALSLMEKAYQALDQPDRAKKVARQIKELEESLQ